MSITEQGNRITLENEYLRRVIDIADGVCTKTYHIRPGGKALGDTWYPVFSFEPSAPFEAAVTLDGKDYEAGPRSCQTEENCQQDLWQRPGAFTVVNTEIGQGKYGDTLDITLESRMEGMPKVELHLVYEICDNMPLLCKKLRLVNTGKEPVTVDHMTVDILRFFDRRLALSVFSNYYSGTEVREIKREDEYYFAWTRLEFPKELGVILAPGEEMESFDLYEAVTSMDRQEESVILHRLYKRLAPWICALRNGLCTNSCQSWQELLDTADMAKEAGFDFVSLHVGQIFTNTGDYIPRPDLFPNGYEDVKRMVEHYHARGIKVLPYCSATIAWRDAQVCMEHPDWQCLGPDGMRYDPFGFGNMCYHSFWGEYIREKLLYLLDEAGFDGLALDGPVHGLVCRETAHSHPSEQAVDYMNWVWEKQFYGEVIARGKLITAPETWNAIFLGVSQIPGGHREEDENEFGGMELMVMKRACAYEARYSTPPCCHSYGIPLEPYHGHSINASEEDTATYAHAAATSFGYGFNAGAFGKIPYIGPKTEAIYNQWHSLYRKYRDTLLGDFIHIAQPNGYLPDAVLHTSETAETPALLVVFNPCGREQTVHYVLPLQYAGLKPGKEVLAEGKTIRLDSVSGAAVEIHLAPYEVKAVPVTRC